MKDDYLWNKKGRDPEIEGLENLLIVYKYTEAEPPVLPPGKAECVKTRFWNLKFALPFAFAGVVIAAVFVIGIWNRSPLGESGMGTLPMKAIPAVQLDDRSGGNAINALGVQPELGKQTPMKRRTLNRGRQLQITKTLFVSKPNVAKAQTASLTKEEKYAYGQLMLALAITGSKLRLVQDTINQIEAPQTAASATQKLNR